MTAPDAIPTQRLEILALRARVVVLERMAFAALELALRVRPEELTLGIEVARSRLADEYEGIAFAPEVRDPAERRYLAQEVERLMRGLQSDLGFQGGIRTPENG